VDQDPDTHLSEKMDPDPHLSEIRIRIKEMPGRKPCNWREFSTVHKNLYIQTSSSS